jgi:hypothetical protein
MCLPVYIFFAKFLSNLGFNKKSDDAMMKLYKRLRGLRNLKNLSG